MVLTLETDVQRELQTGTGVFSRFKADLKIRFKIQQLPELLLHWGSHGFHNGVKFMPKKPQVYMV